VRRIALVRRGLLDPRQERCCVFCFRDDETSQHLFFESSFSYRIWSGIFDWFGVQGPVVHYSISCVLSAIWLVNKKVKIKKETIHSMDGRSLVYMDEQQQDNI
jgi:hypothetical protein